MNDREHADKQNRMRQLERALELYLDASDSGPANLEEVTGGDEELRELLEPMLDGEVSPDGEPRADGLRNVVDQEGTLDRILRDFRLVREIGRGGMGVVYEAEQVSLQRRVALKILPEARALSSTSVARFRREASTLASLDHPNIVKAHAIDTDGQTHFLAMELVVGAPLDAVLENLRDSSELNFAMLRDAVRKAIRPAESSCADSWAASACFEAIAELIAQVADALAHAHESGIVHRDVKPANILVRPDGSPVLTDFGLARQEDRPALTRTGELAGTPYYMSPEQVQGDKVDGDARPDHRVDVFSLGVVLYECLTLKRPFDGRTSQAVFRRIVTQEPRDPRRLNRDVPADLVAIAFRALEKDPKRRYETARAFAEDLRAFVAHRPIRARRARSLERLQRWARREPLKAALVGVLALGVPSIGGLSAYLIGKTPEIVAGERALIEPEVDAAVARGFAEMGEGSFDSSRADLERALKLAPNCVEAVAGLCFLDAREKGFAPAVDALGRFDDLVARSPALLRVKARMLRNSGAEARAVAVENGLPKPAADVDWFVLGMHEMHDGHAGVAGAFERAEKLLHRAVLGSKTVKMTYYLEWAHAAGHVRDPEIAADVEAALSGLGSKSPRARFWLGFAHVDTDPARAAKSMREAVNLEPKWMFGWINFAETLLKAGQYEAAIEAALRAKDLAPESHRVWLVVGRIRNAAEDHEGAVAAFREAAKWGPSDGEAHRMEAQTLLQLQRNQEAFEAAVVAVRRNAQRAAGWAVLGEAARRLGDFKRARESYERAVGLYPDDAEMWRGLSLTYKAMRDNKATFRAYRQVLRLNPNDHATRINAANMLLRARRFEEAETDLSLVLAAQPALFQANNSMLILCLESKERADVVSHCAAWTKRAPDEGLAWFYLGRYVFEYDITPDPKSETSVVAKQALERARQLFLDSEANGGTPRPNELKMISNLLARLDKD